MPAPARMECTIISENLLDPRSEAARVVAVERYRIVDTPPDRIFTRIAALAARFLDAPMAVVSIVDGDRIWFTAMHGFDRAVTSVAHADGLCASAVVADGPHVVHDALSEGRAFAVDHGIDFYACAPIVNFDGYRIGAVAVMDHHDRDASEEQIGVLDDLAAIVMEQLELRLSALDALRLERRRGDDAEDARDDARGDLGQARLDRDDARRDRDDARRNRDAALRDRDIAERERDETEEYAAVLQRTLLPPSLPVIDGLSTAVHYHPASPRQVGGDFYDVFELGGGRWAFFVGDVEGHGTGAAAATSLIRYSLRSAAFHYADPVEVLDELNLVLLRETDRRRFCTVLFGTLARSATGSGFDLEIATGGHPPALLLDPAEATVETVRSRGGMLVGATPNAAFDSCHVTVQPGQTLLFYTDGIIEARRGDDPFDEDRLARFALDHVGDGAAHLVGELATLIPKLDPEDDVAVLALHVD